MINKFMEIMYQKVYQCLNDKTVELIKRKSKKLGIQIKQGYHKQRIIFLVSQHISHYIDLHVNQSKNINKTKTCNIHEIIKQINHENSTNYRRNHSVYFNMAVFLNHYICGNFDILKSVKFIEEMERQYLALEEDEITLEVFKENQHIKQLENQRQFFCICKYDANKQTIRCEKCMRPFHPQCQYQKLLCNRCYLTHYMHPIDSYFLCKFGERRNTSTYFHGKFRCFNPFDSQKTQLFVIKFDIDDLFDLKNASQPEFMIKIMNFKDLSNGSTRHQKWKLMTTKTTQSSMILNSNRFQFFLNFFQLKRKQLYFRNENSLIFKLENRLPDEKDNILLIKCDIDFFQDDTYQIGIYRTTKSKQTDQQNNLNDSSSHLMNIQHQNLDINRSYRITRDQFRLLNNYSTIIEESHHKLLKFQPTKIKSQEQLSKDHFQKGFNSQLVRSYGCNHKQGFNLSQLKRIHQSYIQAHRKSKNNKQLKREIQKFIENELFRQYKTHAMRMNVKTEEELVFNKQNISSVRQYCIDNNLIRLIDISELQKFDKNLVNAEIKKYIGRYQTKSDDKRRFFPRTRNEMNLKQQKKYMKFVKCPICKNHLSVLYLLPYEFKQGEEIKSLRVNKTLKKKKIINQQQVKHSLVDMFKSKTVFRVQKGKKEEQSDSFEEIQDQKPAKRIEQNKPLKELLFDQSFLQSVMEKSIQKHNLKNKSQDRIQNNNQGNESETIFIEEQLKEAKKNQEERIIIEEIKVMSEEQSYSQNSQQISWQSLQYQNFQIQKNYRQSNTEHISNQISENNYKVQNQQFDGKNIQKDKQPQQNLRSESDKRMLYSHLLQDQSQEGELKFYDQIFF